MKQYRLLQDISTFDVQAKKGTIGVERIDPLDRGSYLDTKIWFDNGRFFYMKSTVVKHPTWFEEVNTVEKGRITDWYGIAHQARGCYSNTDAAEFLKNQFKILQNSLNPEPSSKKEEVEDKPFVWTDELVKEFIEHKGKYMSVPDVVGIAIEEFKKSKTKTNE